MLSTTLNMVMLVYTTIVWCILKNRKVYFEPWQNFWDIKVINFFIDIICSIRCFFIFSQECCDLSMLALYLVFIITFWSGYIFDIVDDLVVCVNLYHDRIGSTFMNSRSISIFWDVVQQVCNLIVYVLQKLSNVHLLIFI